jgi:multicomponent Na+:H+ antiporter subunit D
MTTWLHPAAILIIGALLVPLFKGKLKQAYLVLIPIAALIDVLLIYAGVFGEVPFSAWTMPFLGYELVFGRVDKLSSLFGLIFALVSVPAIFYALNIKNSSDHMVQFIYSGCALGVVFAGDFISLYIFWEIMSIASMLIIWHGGTEKSHNAGFRYIMWHVAGGVVLLAGIVMYIATTGTIAFNAIEWGSLSALLIFIGFILNAGVPPFHAWLPDAYPEATAPGAVYLSVYTTKSAVYVLARGFAGFGPLIWLGAIMTVYPIFYAVLENNLRRVLSYSLINQVGFMLCGIGIGTPLAINGAVSHAFAHIIYKGLLFMSVGSVLHRTGTAKATELGGIYKYMPLTCVFCLVGAASISGFPIFSGFVTKSMTVTASALGGFALVYLLLQLASAGVFHHAGIKVPFFTFFGVEDSKLKPKEAPINMLVGMGIMAFLCVFIGLYPWPLYNILPYPVNFNPYTPYHVVELLQLLLFASLAFFLLLTSGLYPPEQNKINLDTDWPLRIAGRKIMWFINVPLMNFGTWMNGNLNKIAMDFSAFGEAKEERILIGVSVLLGLLFFAVYLIIELIYKFIA